VTDRIESQILLGYNQFLCAESLVAGEKFSLSLFEDLNKIIEAVVLYDRIVLIGDYSLTSSIFAAPLEKAGALKKLSDANFQNVFADKSARSHFSLSMANVFGPQVLDIEDAQPEELIKLRISPSSRDMLKYRDFFLETIECGKAEHFERDRLTNWVAQNIFEQRKCSNLFYYLARAVLYSTFAERFEMDYAPDVLRFPIAALTFSRGTTPLPKTLYDALCKKVHSEIEALVLLGMPVAVFVPPLAAKLLSRVRSLQDCPSELLELRENFSGFRTAYGEFLAVLKDPQVTLDKKIDAKKKMISRITGIITKGESRHALHVKSIWDKMVSSSLDEAGISNKLSLSGFVSVLMDQLTSEGIKGHARALFDLWTDTLNIKNYGELIEKSFKRTIESAEIDQFNLFSEAVRKLIKCTGEVKRWGNHSSR
jgi:hypothetical protein